jgi:hypothetical protein
MLKKLFITAAAAAAMSVPLAAVASADRPADPGAGNQGVPDRATNFVESTFGTDATDGLQSGNSGVVAPGTVYAQGAQLPDANAPDGYATVLNGFYQSQGFPNPNYDSVVPGSATRQLTAGCAHHSSGVCIP